MCLPINVNVNPLSNMDIRLGLTGSTYMAQNPACVCKYSQCHFIANKYAIHQSRKASQKTPMSFSFMICYIQLYFFKVKLHHRLTIKLHNNELFNRPCIICHTITQPIKHIVLFIYTVGVTLAILNSN